MFTCRDIGYIRECRRPRDPSCLGVVQPLTDRSIILGSLLTIYIAELILYLIDRVMLNVARGIGM